MATVSDFEDLEAWQQARVLTRGVYRAARTEPLQHDFSLSDQLRRSARSSMGNIAEGFDRGGRNEFLHFLSIAKASAAECRSDLYVALDAGLIAESTFEELRAQAKRTGQLIGGLMSYLRKSPHRGSKFHDRV